MRTTGHGIEVSFELFAFDNEPSRQSDARLEACTALEALITYADPSNYGQLIQVLCDSGHVVEPVVDGFKSAPCAQHFLRVSKGSQLLGRLEVTTTGKKGEV